MVVFEMAALEYRLITSFKVNTNVILVHHFWLVESERDVLYGDAPQC